MPLYEYRCRTCKRTFELLRPMSEAQSLASCPGGHTDAERVVSLVARVRGGDGAETIQSFGGGGCACGGAACGCGH
jgi:putative FmdB family regulatory protein